MSPATARGRYRRSSAVITSVAGRASSLFTKKGPLAQPHPLMANEANKQQWLSVALEMEDQATGSHRDQDITRGAAKVPLPFGPLATAASGSSILLSADRPEADATQYDRRAAP